MLLLVTDTSGKNGVVALARADYDPGKEVVVIATAPLAGGAFSAQLVPQISALLEQNNLNKSDIDAFVVVSGPGSFTGIRVGLAAIKALAEILAKPIVSVSLLEVLAAASNHTGKVFAALDAGRAEIYAGLFDLDNSGATPLWEELRRRDELSGFADTFLVTTDPLLAEASRAAGIQTLLLDEITPQLIAQCGLRKLSSNRWVSPDKLEANYIRQSDARIASKPILS